MSKNLLGDLAESKVIARLVELGFEVFVPLFCHSSIDLIAIKGKKQFKISVKGSSTKRGETFLTYIRSIRTNNTQTKIVKFSSTHCDILAVYIRQLDVVCFLPAAEISESYMIGLRTSPSPHAGKQGNSFIIEEFLELK